MSEHEYTWDMVTCDMCGEPAPYQLWRGEQLHASYCEHHHHEWWGTHDRALHGQRDAAAAYSGFTFSEPKYGPPEEETFPALPFARRFDEETAMHEGEDVK